MLGIVADMLGSRERMNGYNMTQFGQSLPTRLGLQVLIDAVFEIRFTPKQGVADLLPGVLLHAFDEKPRVERLPLADVPQQVRAMQPDLAGQPLVRLVWPTHSIFIGDSLLGVACSLPYPGWKKFKNIIDTLVNNDSIHDVVNPPTRFSLKYVDFLPDSEFDGIKDKLNWQVSIAGNSIVDTPLSLRNERVIDGYACVMEVHSPAQVQVQATEVGVPAQKFGTIVSFDLIKNSQPNSNWDEFLEVFDSQVEFLHAEVKKRFFECLAPEVFKLLNPSYD